MRYLNLMSVLIFICLISGTRVEAKLLDSETKTVVVEVKSATFELSAKCIGPKFEDDSFKTYFSEESYQEAKEYLNSGSSWKLLDKSCGYEPSDKPQLSFDEYQKVTVFFVDGKSPRDLVEGSIKEIWESKD